MSRARLSSCCLNSHWSAVIAAFFSLWREVASGRNTCVCVCGGLVGGGGVVQDERWGWENPSPFGRAYVGTRRSADLIKQLFFSFSFSPFVGVKRCSVEVSFSAFSLQDAADQGPRPGCNLAGCCWFGAVVCLVSFFTSTASLWPAWKQHNQAAATWRTSEKHRRHRRVGRVHVC